MSKTVNTLSRTRFILAALMAAAVALPGAARAAGQAADIGDVQLVRIWATGTPTEAQTRDLFVDDAIFRNEVVETVRDGGLHLRFKDGTDFRLGSNSRATLDKFVYDPASHDGQLALTLKQGIFRFKTGQMKKEGIRLLTAVAEIEVHGTDVTIEVQLDGTVRVTVNEGEAVMTAKADGSKVTMVPGGDGGQVTPGGPAKPYAGLVGFGDLGIADASGFETQPTITAASTSFDERPTEQMYESTSAGQTTKALSPLAVFTDDSQQALETVVTGEGPFAAAPAAPSQVVALASTVMTDGTLTGAVTNAVTNSAVNTMANTVTNTITNTVTEAAPVFNIPLNQVFALLIQWGPGARDLDLHLTGPDVDGGRFHVYFSNPGNLFESPYALLTNDDTGTAGQEVIAVSQVNQGGVYRASVYNFGDSSPTSNNLSTQSDVQFSLYSGGQIIESPNSPQGFVIEGGGLVATATPTTSDAGNTWVIGELDPATGDLTLTNEVTNSDSSSSVQ